MGLQAMMNCDICDGKDKRMGRSDAFKELLYPFAWIVVLFRGFKYSYRCIGAVLILPIQVQTAMKL